MSCSNNISVNQKGSKVYSNGKYEELIAKNNKIGELIKIKNPNDKFMIIPDKNQLIDENDELYMEIFMFLKEHPDKHKLISNILENLFYNHMGDKTVKLLMQNLNIIIMITNNYTNYLFNSLMNIKLSKYKINIISDLIIHLDNDLLYKYPIEITQNIKTYDELNLFLEIFDITSDKLKDCHKYYMFLKILKKDFVDINLIKIFNPGYEIIHGFDYNDNHIMIILNIKNITIDIIKYICSIYNYENYYTRYEFFLNKMIKKLLISNNIYKHRNILNYLLTERYNCQFRSNYESCLSELCETFDNIPDEYYYDFDKIKNCN